jgi:hypothetical protein
VSASGHSLGNFFSFIFGDNRFDIFVQIELSPV